MQQWKAAEKNAAAENKWIEAKQQRTQCTASFDARKPWKVLSTFFNSTYILLRVVLNEAKNSRQELEIFEWIDWMKECELRVCLNHRHSDWIIVVRRPSTRKKYVSIAEERNSITARTKKKNENEINKIKKMSSLSSLRSPPFSLSVPSTFDWFYQFHLQ